MKVTGAGAERSILKWNNLIKQMILYQIHNTTETTLERAS